MRLLSRTSSFETDRATTIVDITKKIDYLLSSLTNRRRSKQRMAGLKDIVEWASNLALDLAKQRALVKLNRPSDSLGAFDPGTMLEVTGEEEREGEVTDLPQSRGKQVKLCVFPAVVRQSDESGVGFDKEHLVSKAQVLL
jgi:hypothetical protein